MTELVQEEKLDETPITPQAQEEGKDQFSEEQKVSFPCLLCGQNFESQSQLNGHQKAHRTRKGQQLPPTSLGTTQIDELSELRRQLETEKTQRMLAEESVKRLKAQKEIEIAGKGEQTDVIDLELARLIKIRTLKELQTTNDSQPLQPRQNNDGVSAADIARIVAEELDKRDVRNARDGESRPRNMVKAQIGESDDGKPVMVELPETLLPMYWQMIQSKGDSKPLPQGKRFNSDSYQFLGEGLHELSDVVKDRRPLEYLIDVLEKWNKPPLPTQTTATQDELISLRQQGLVDMQ